MSDIDTNAPAPEAPIEGASATPSAPPAAQAAAVKAEIRKLKLKFDGKEEELSEEEVIKLAQMGKLGTKKAQEKAVLEKDITAFFQKLKADPFAVLQDPAIGLDVKKLVVDYIEQQVAEEQKTPAQKEKEALLKELEAERAKSKKTEDEKQSEKLAREQEKAAREIDTQMDGALKKVGLPVSPYTLKRMADFMLQALEQNMDLTPEDVGPLVKKEIQNDIKQMFSSSPDELIEEFLGKERLGGMKKKQLAAVKQATQGISTKTTATGQSSTPTSQAQKKIAMKDFFKLR